MADTPTTALVAALAGVVGAGAGFALGREMDRPRPTASLTKGTVWFIDRAIFVDSPFIDAIASSFVHERGGWRIYNGRKVVLEARRADVTPLPGQVGALYILRKNDETSDFINTLVALGLLGGGVTYASWADMRAGKGYLA